MGAMCPGHLELQQAAAAAAAQRMLCIWMLATLVVLTIGAPSSEDHDLNFVVRNITALWEEVSDIRQEIVRHLHEGHKEDKHDEVMQEVEDLHHEHHVHHLHHPHKGHNEHHSNELLKHLEEAHGHIDDHTAGQTVHGHLHGHGASHDHLHRPPKPGDHDDIHESVDDDSDESYNVDDDDRDDHEYDHDHSEHIGHKVIHANPDEHDTHGLHSHEDEHEYGHEHGHDHISDDVDHHGRHDHDDHNQGLPSLPGSPGVPGMAQPSSHPLPGSLRSGRHPSDTWKHASCALKPNKDMSTSNVHGSVVISQRKDGKGPVYFNIHLSGIDIGNTGRRHGFHVHERQVTDDSCGSTGGHFNPAGMTHGAPEDELRHVGDLGNIEVDENGELHGYIIDDEKVAFDGANSIIGKALVVHAGVDDLGQGGDAGSLLTGNAGGRLACCTIYMGASTRQEDLVTFRMKG